MSVAVVIPIYKSKRSELKWYETISLQRCVEVLGHYPIVFVAPSETSIIFRPKLITGLSASIRIFLKAGTATTD